MSKSTQVNSSHKIRRRHRRRRGATTLMFIMLLFIGIGTLVVVLNWLFVMMASHRTTQVVDMIALSAVMGLLDDDVLKDVPVSDAITNQGTTGLDDVGELEDLVEQFRLLNNASSSSRFRLEADDVDCIPGWVENVKMPVTGDNFKTDPGDLSGRLYNTVRLDVIRDPNGDNPLQLLIRAFGADDAVKISTAAYAVLDSRVVGYRPTSAITAPVMPIAIQYDAWFTTRPANNDDTNGNMRRELDINLKSAAGNGLANGALIAIDETTLDLGYLPSQILDGIIPDDIKLGKVVFGPATDASPLPVPARETSPSTSGGDPIDTVTLIDIINNELVANPSEDTRRVFPLFRTFGATTNLVGFVGADILSADNIGTAGDPRLSITVEPAFVVHVTAATDPAADENLYLHKIRLAR